MAEQLWKGRFSKAVDSRVNDFNSSIRFDQRMIAQDMRGSGVHAAMLARQGIISEQDCADILSGLASIADDLSSGALTIDPAAEDVHTFVEQTLTARIGDAGKRLHTGRSRNDQVALDIRLTLRDYSHTLQAYIVENRLVGMKSRGVYETPGGAILYKAIDVLETITLDKESAHFKAQLAQKYADIVYNGQWFTPLREALDAFADSLEKTVTGDVKLKLYKGNMINAGVTSPYTLYDEQTASFGVDKDYDQSDATGFINLFGLSIKERAKLSKNWPEVK